VSVCEWALQVESVSPYPGREDLVDRAAEGPRRDVSALDGIVPGVVEKPKRASHSRMLWPASWCVRMLAQS
jgi:hypothetical protein